MALYRYKAVSQSGEMVEGELTGASKAAVVERLHQLGHTPIRAEEIGRAGAMPLLQRRVLGGERVGRREITLFTREMATLLGAGLTLERALEVLGGIADSQTMRRLVNRLLETIRGGTSFADA
jgi:general secretion pathway protein F